MTNSGGECLGEVPGSVPAMLSWRRHHDPGTVFLLTPDGAERTYSLLGHRVDELAAHLGVHGVAPGDVVGVYAGNDPAWVVAAFAVWAVGAAVAACGGLTPPAEVERRLDLVGARLAVVAEGLDSPAGRAIVGVDTEGQVLEAAPVEPHSVPEAIVPDLDTVAAIMFTSGTTGAAKPVAFTHRRLADAPSRTAGAYSASSAFRTRTGHPGKAPAINFNPFGHAASMGRMVFRMYVGRSLLLVPKFDVAVLGELAERYPLDTLALTPAMIHAIAYAESDLDLRSLRYVTSGTAPLPIATRERFEARYRVPVLQAYGATEGGVTALERYDDVVAGRRGPGSVGRVPEGIPFRIVDDEGNDVPPGAEGELVGQVDPTASMRSSDGEESVAVGAGGWYRTGDLARLDEHGILYICGRRKEMLIVGGFNVYPGEVEDVLRRSPLVHDAVVVAKPDDRLGEVPVAAIVWQRGSSGVGSDARQFLLGERFAGLREHCRALLEPYKVPRQFFELDAAPLTANGKLDRNRVAELAGAALGALPIDGGST